MAYHFRNKFHALFNPEQFHGWGKRRKYFEGWYYKIISADERQAFAFIPGIAMDETGHQQSFIQVLDGKKLTADYHKYPIGDFNAEPKTFQVKIANSEFSTNQISLDLPEIKGRLKFMDQVPWSTAWYSPGIMGPFSFVPFMQCYHGILSMDHQIEGVLNIKGKAIDFTGGRGYMEKDWGSSFPSAYIWMQTNHFSQPGISIKLSVAKIPWLGSSFVGFIAGVWLGDQLIEFTTYNLTRLKKSFADEARVEIELENRTYRLKVTADREASTTLAAPNLGFMDGRIEESMTAKISVKLFDKRRQVMLLDDVGRNAGLEVAGNIPEILK